MIKKYTLPLLLLLLSVLVQWTASFNMTAIKDSLNTFSSDDYKVDFYPTYGYLDGDEWIIPMKAYVYEPRGYLESIILSMFQSFREFEDEESEIFRNRIITFAADSESRERVDFVFDNDPEQIIFTILNEIGEPLRTNLNGMIEGEIRISVSHARQLLESQQSENNWLTFHAVSEDHSGTGKIRLIVPEGLSVITDIDDTIKISELPAGSRIAARNAFFKEYAAAPGMPDLFRQWEHTPVHYVSGTPRQFYRPLSEFLIEKTGFPEGTFHLRGVRKNLFSLSTWRNLEDIISDENVTLNHKMQQMSHIMQHFPDREFILIGDSGQHDPEIFREIDETFPGQVREIIIRDISNDRELNPKRLEGMTIIPAETIEEGITQFN